MESICYTATHDKDFRKVSGRAHNDPKPWLVSFFSKYDPDLS